MRAKHPIWVPVALTIAYFGYAILTPVHADWFTAFVRSLMLGGAAAASLAVWTYYAFWVRRRARRLRELFVVGLVPVALLGCAELYSGYRSRRLAALETRVRTEARLVRIDDEELLTPRGNPIGVRLRYEVHYPEGSDELIPHIPPAGLSMVPLPYLSGFWVLNTESRALNATDYAMTSDVVPEFMPKMIRFPENAGKPGSGSSDPCFVWSRGAAQRAEVIDGSPRTFWVSLGEPRYSAPTRRSYDLHRFVEGAVAEGARECP